jgi:type I restriction enzyme M protein
LEQPEQSSLRRKFVEEHDGRFGDLAVYGQESNLAMRRLAMMKLPLRGIECDLDPV